MLGRARDGERDELPRPPFPSSAQRATASTEARSAASCSSRMRSTG